MILSLPPLVCSQNDLVKLPYRAISYIPARTDIVIVFKVAYCLAASGGLLGLLLKVVL